jgi:cob(I)alamin adenosyltransferase
MKKPNTNADEISALVNEISQFVDNIIYESQGTIDTAPELTNELLNDADDVLAILSDIRNELLDLGEDILDHPEDRQIKQKVANSSYEVAKVKLIHVACQRFVNYSGWLRIAVLIIYFAFD